MIYVYRSKYRSISFGTTFDTLIIRFSSFEVSEYGFKTGDHITLSKYPMTINKVYTCLGNRIIRSNKGFMALLPDFFDDRSIKDGIYELIPVEDCVKPQQFIMKFIE